MTASQIIEFLRFFTVKIKNHQNVIFLSNHCSPKSELLSSIVPVCSCSFWLDTNDSAVGAECGVCGTLAAI